MKFILLPMTVQVLLLFIFLYDPNALNLGQRLWIIPQWGTNIASIMGNIVWLWGLRMIMVCGNVITELLQGAANIRMIAQYTADSNPVWPDKLVYGPLTHSAYVLYVIGMASGFWFTGLMGILVLVSLTTFRHEFWKCIKSNKGSIFSRTTKTGHKL